MGPRHFAVQGTPTDSVIMAVRQLMQDKKPDLVLSGVNRGQNVAEDVTYSGTIAAAMEGTLLGIPSMAVSLSYGGQEGRESRTGAASKPRPKMIKKIVALGIPGRAHQHQFSRLRGERGARRRVHFAGTRNVELVRVEQRRDGRGVPYYWLMFQRAGFTPAPGTDLEALAAKKFL